MFILLLALNTYFVVGVIMAVINAYCAYQLGKQATAGDLLVATILWPAVIVEAYRACKWFKRRNKKH